MSNFIQVDLESAPDKFEQLPAGIYTTIVESASVEPTKDGSGQKVVVVLVVKDNEKFDGKKIFDHLSLKMPISLKHLVQSCGLPLNKSGLDVSELVGKTCKIRITTRTYTDQGGEVKETPSVKEYMH